MSLILPRAYREDPSLFDGLSLGRRDPDYIRDYLPFLELMYRYWFRVEARGFANVPAEGPMLLVGNHNGGINTPDTAMTAHAWFTHYGVERPVYALIHPAIFTVPYLNVHAMKMGGIAATAGMTMAALGAGAPLLLYPGGGDEAYRPFSRRHEIMLCGRDGFARIALRYRIPVVPVVALGGHETLIVLDEGRALAQGLGLDRLGIERVPIAITFPFGLTIGAPSNVPFPVKIEIEICPPVDFGGLGPEAARDPEAVRACYDKVVAVMQATLDRMVAARAERRARRRRRGAAAAPRPLAGGPR
jgi:1-acyl-sn-glycerol-3-phosphate acyltransferase